MPIAQHTVAGEGDAYPLVTETSATEDDSQARVAFSCDTTNLPWVIFRAAHRAAHLQGMPARSRALLAALARTVDANRPYAAIFARRELLTGRAMQSMRTFYRSLDDLQAAGLIERAPQKRYGEAGLFGRAYLHLTNRAAQLLGLVAPVEPTIETSAVPSTDVPAPVPLDPPSARVADGAIYKDLYPASQKRQPGTLPADLQRLTSLGFREFLIFKLMREARENGKLLSDVVEATWQHLKAAKRPISYLRALLRSTADFEYQVRTKAAEAQAAQDAQIERRRVDLAIERCAGRVFVDRSGEHRFDIASEGQSVMVYALSEAVPRVAVSGWRPQFVAALERGDIVAAAPVDLEAFAAARRQAMTPACTAEEGGAAPKALMQRARDELRSLKALLRAKSALA
ncbi:MAG: Replication protein O [Paraburkholderia sp.]|uniref:Replication protein O n=1 Tax=Paraburkholderia sp. TaxID=1926495 RepID=UPI00120DD0C7|nr:Replication protein O [Paraburkholderia sp.]TAM06376.1 MAG: Replication protein O [Paraburkholderia sp.]